MEYRIRRVHCFNRRHRCVGVYLDYEPLESQYAHGALIGLFER